MRPSTTASRVPLDRPRAGGSGARTAIVLAYRIPDFLVVLLAVVTTMAVASDAVGIRPIAHWWSSLLLVALSAAAAGLVARSAGSAVAERRSAWALLAAGVILLYALIARFLSLGHRAEWFIGGDHVRHLHYVAEVQGAGALSYAVQPYPRAWHTLVASIWSAFGGRPDAGGFRWLLDLQSTATWLLPGVLGVATASVALALARRLHVGGRWAHGAAAVAGAAVLLPPYLPYYQAFGFESSYVAAVAAAVSVRVVLARPDRFPAVLLSGCALVVLAHTWQLLMPIAMVALVASSWCTLRRQAPRGVVLAIVATWATAAVASLPAVRAVYTVVGVGHAAVSDVQPPVPLLMLVLTCLAALLVVLTGRGDHLVLVASGMVLVPGATGIALSLRLGVPLTDYYPGKLVWHTAVMGPAFLAVLLGPALERSALPAHIRRVAHLTATAVAAAVVVVALVTPVGAFTGRWSVADGPAVVDAVTSPGAASADVVWLGSQGSDTMARILLDFYRAGRTWDRRSQAPLDVEGECRILLDSDVPTVLSDKPESQVRSRYACVPDLRVVPAR